MVRRIRQLYLFKSFRTQLIEEAYKVGWFTHNLDWPGLMLRASEITEKIPVPMWRI
jgi:hypothetical protein